MNVDLINGVSISVEPDMNAVFFDGHGMGLAVDLSSDGSIEISIRVASGETLLVSPTGTRTLSSYGIQCRRQEQ